VSVVKNVNLNLSINNTIEAGLSGVDHEVRMDLNLFDYHVWYDMLNL